MAGVLHVRVNRNAGSVTIDHDPATIGTDALISVLQDIGHLHLHDATPGPHAWRVETGAPSALSDKVVGTAVRLDRELLAVTDGGADLRVLVPLALALLAGRRATSRLEPVPWYQWAWWAFDSFTKLRRNRLPVQ